MKKRSLDVVKAEEAKVWEYMGPNWILGAPDFFVSYNPGNYGISFFMSDTGGSETALVKDDQYFILNGDFRPEYEAVIDLGFEACLQVYKNNLSHKSSWSNED